MMKLRNVLHSMQARYGRYTKKRKIALVALVGGIVVVLIPVATYAYYAHDISNPDRLMNHNNTGVVLLDKNGEPFYTRGVVKNIRYVHLHDISPNVPKALLASEDAEFYSEPGFSIKGMGRALFSNLSNGSISSQGGSTITQQLVKNSLLTSRKNYFRKYQELSMAVAIDHKYSKDRILEMYLNSVYFGDDSFGIESAAQAYYGKSARDLNLAESSMLVGLLPAPSAYSPITGSEKLAKKRQDYVLTRMVQEKYISRQQKQTAEDETLTYKKPSAALTEHAQHFALMVIDQLNKKYGEEKVSRSGLRVRTTLDLNWQKTAEIAVTRQLKALRSYGARNGAMIAIDPHTGEIRALVGSADWDNGEYGKVNMVLRQRQPGSSFKPLYYTEAIQEKKITAATILQDKPTDFGGGYKPKNYDGKYHGDVTARYALADSMNIPAVEVMRKLGVQNAVTAVQRMGVHTVNQPQKYGLSLALGTAEVRLVDMTNAYAAFANQGDQFSVTSISSIQDKFGKTIYRYHPTAHRVMSKEATYIISSILSDEKARFPLAGNKFNIGRPVAVKTGTTNDNRDAWTIGYTPQITVGVWVGNNDNTSMRGVGGSFGAGPIWRATISSFLKGQKTEPFSQPSHVKRLLVCSVNGTYYDYFVPGTEGDYTCTRATRASNTKDTKKHDREEKGNSDGSESAPPKQTTTGNGNDPGGTGDGSGGTGSTTGGDGSGTGTGGGTGDGSGGTTTPPPPPPPPPSN